MRSSKEACLMLFSFADDPVFMRESRKNNLYMLLSLMLTAGLWIITQTEWSVLKNYIHLAMALAILMVALEAFLIWYFYYSGMKMVKALIMDDEVNIRKA